MKQQMRDQKLLKQRSVVGVAPDDRQQLRDQLDKIGREPDGFNQHLSAYKKQASVIMTNTKSGKPMLIYNGEGEDDEEEQRQLVE